MAELSLTPAAVSYLQPLLKEVPGVIGVRVGVKKAGCSGYEYFLEYAKDVRLLERSFEQDGVRILVDPETLEKFLKGTEIDFQEDGLDQGLQFNNPNVQAKCGCGESFTLKEAKDHDV